MSIAEVIAATMTAVVVVLMFLIVLYTFH